MVRTELKEEVGNPEEVENQEGTGCQVIQQSAQSRNSKRSGGVALVQKLVNEKYNNNSIPEICNKTETNCTQDFTLNCIN